MWEVSKVPERSSEVDGVHHGGDDGQRGGKVRSLVNVKVNIKLGKCDGNFAADNTSTCLGLSTCLKTKWTAKMSMSSRIRPIRTPPPIVRYLSALLGSNVDCCWGFMVRTTPSCKMSYLQTCLWAEGQIQEEWRRCQRSQPSYVLEVLFGSWGWCGWWS